MAISKVGATALVLFALIAMVGAVTMWDINVTSSNQSIQGVVTNTVTVGGAGASYSTPTCSSQSGNTSVTLVAKRAQVQIANNVTYDAWTFNGTVPGPAIFVKQCENVHFTLINNDTLAHAIDFHAAQVNWATVYQPVAPNQSFSFNFTPAYPGIFMYHCGVPPVLEHIANGMYGVIIVNGTGSSALPPAPGGQYVIMESEFYLNNQPNPDGSYSGNYTKMLAATPDYVVFNGKAFQYQTNPLVVQPNQLVRLYIFNEGPSLWEAFHVLGGVMDSVYIDGNPFNVQHGLQTVSIPPSGGAIVDMYFTDPGGLNPFVTHAFAYAQAGAVGVFRVANGSSSTGVTTTGSTPSGPQVSIQPGSGANTTSLYYSPETIKVVIGSNNTVTWVNNDNAVHTVTDSGVFDSGLIQPGQSWTHTFTTPGTYLYRCTIHPWMTGTIVVESG